MRSSNLIFIAGLIFILLTDTIFWIQLKQYLNKKWQILLYGLHLSLIHILTGGTPRSAKNFTLRFRQTPPVGRSEKARRPTEATGPPNTNTGDEQVKVT